VKSLVCILGLVAANIACAQDAVRVPFSDPSRPKTVKVNMVQGSITVTGGGGNEVVIESRGGERRRDRDRDRSEGLRRIDMGATGLTAEEQDNVVVIKPSVASHSNLTLQVPTNVNLDLKTGNGGNITVENVTGELDVQNVNGGVRLNNVSGAVIAHALNGNVVVSLNQVRGDKPMSFTSLNGNIDVTLPQDLKAQIKLKNSNGETYSDFDVTLQPSKTVVESSKGGQGKYRIQVDRTMTGTINGGGPEFQFQTMNGNIYIRKKK
jgi:hypothetical protein